MEINFRDYPEITEIKEELNLFMFNSKFYSVNDMVFTNQLFDFIQNMNLRIDK